MMRGMVPALALLAIWTQAAWADLARCRDYRGNRPVPALSQTTIIAEAEEFAIDRGWEARPWGENQVSAAGAFTGGGHSHMLDRRKACSHFTVV